MERKIGEIFEYDGEWYQCVGGTCRNCSFYWDTVCKNITTIGSTNFGNCHCSLRTDHKSVIFKKLEKVGEPFTDNGKLYQRYEVFDIDRANARSGVSMYVPVGNEKFVCIEIKQNKKMEENKLNLKPFDLEQAKAGKPVCTRDGRKARIVCFDAKGCYPIIALTAELDNTEDITKCTEKGISSYHKNNDLMMLPGKKEGWINIYKKSNGECYFAHIYDTKALAEIGKDAGCIATVRIEWEEQP